MHVIIIKSIRLSFAHGQPFRLTKLRDLSSERKMWPRLAFVLAGVVAKEKAEELKLGGVGET
jgi:hypothetical protein